MINIGKKLAKKILLIKIMSSPSLSQPLGSLGVNPQMTQHMQYGYGCMDGFGFYLIWFLIIAIVTWVILYSVRPNWVLQADGELNAGKVLLWSVVVGLIGIFIIWLIRRCGNKMMY
jgi:hypothetical protein